MHSNCLPYLIIAFILHFILIFHFSFLINSEKNMAGYETYPIVTTYFSLNQHISKKTTHQEPLTTATQEGNPFSSSTHLSQSLPPELITHTKGHEKFLERLHNTIQSHQLYPEEAIFMRETGMATVEFLLLPNGQLQQVELIKSSGSAALDQAALAAVNTSSPIAKPPIKIPTRFRIDIDFTEVI